MKRIVSCFLITLLLVSSFCNASFTILAADEPVFTVATVPAHPGDTVNVTVSIGNNPGIASVKLKAAFGDALVLNSVTYNTELGGASHQPQTFGSPVTLNWINGEANTTGDMTYATLCFTVSDNAAEGTYPVTITYDPEDVFKLAADNLATENVAFGVVNGAVSVTIPVAGIALDNTSATVSTGDGTYTLTPVFTPSNATNKNVSWKSSDETVAAVANGVVSLLKKGEAVITVTSEDGGFEAACTFTVLCSHLASDVVTAVASTCTVQGHGEYTVCRDCGEIIAGSDALLPLAEHQYVENAQPQHLKSVATCASPAVYYKSCSSCGAQSTETFTYGAVDPDNHTGTTHIENQKAASCSEAGFTGDEVCDGCGVTLIPGTVIGKTAHTPGAPVKENEVAATCETAGSYDEVVYCTVCSTELSRDTKNVNALGHAYGEPVYVWADDNGACTATVVCANDGAHNITETVTAESMVKTPASCEGNGITTYTAAFINEAFATQTKDVENIPALGHKFGEWTVSKPATCDEKGTETRTCSECSKTESREIPALGHKFGEWTVSKPATCDEKGTETRTCSECSKTESRDIPALGHKYGEATYSWSDDNGSVTAKRVCSVDPSHVETETADTVYKVTKEATEKETGVGVYTATFKNSAFAAQSRNVTIDKLVPKLKFIDVVKGSFYYDAVDWAVAMGITTGTTPTTFSPNSKCTRGQVVTFLWRAKGSPEPKSTANPFTDVKSTDFYYKAVQWAVENNITAGLSATTFGPKKECTRGHVVTFLWRANGTPAPKSTAHSFTDVKKGAFYYEAMLWAVENGITKGTSNTKFSPGTACTRGQVVTFLYRALA